MKLRGRVPSVAAFLAAVCLTFPTQGKAGDAEANALFVEAVSAMKSMDQASGIHEELDILNQALANLDMIVTEHPSSNLAVSIVTGQTIGTVNPEDLRQQRDALQKQVEQADAQLAAETQANERHDAWVETTMACIEDFACMEDLYLVEMQRLDGTVSALLGVAEKEALRNGFSDRFDDYYNQLIQQFPGENGVRYESKVFFQVIASAIAQEKPKTVYARMREFEGEYSHPDYPGEFDRFMVLPAEVATLIGQPKKVQQYLDLMVDDGFFLNREEAESELIESMYSVSFAEMMEMKDKGLSSDSPLSETQVLLPFLAQTASPDFEHEWKNVYEGYETEYDAVRYRLMYLAASGQAQAAADCIYSDDPEANMLYWAGELANASRINHTRESERAVRELTRLGLENKDGEELSAFDLYWVFWISHLIN